MFSRYNPPLASTLLARGGYFMLVLGLDPGSVHTGYGVILKTGSNLQAQTYGRFSAPRDGAVALRLANLCQQLDALLDRIQPDLVVVEAPFFGINAKSLVTLAQARGALLARLGGRGLVPAEYSPAEVKSAVTGNGRADKTQVARMVGLLLGLPAGRLPADATDALAVALCGAQRHRLTTLTSRSSRST